MICLSIEKLGLAFGVDVLLHDISFSLNDGDKLGIVGVNGAGKSTLFKLITGEYTPTEGNVYIDKKKKLGILTQNATISSDNTLYEEVLNQAFSELICEENELESLKSRMESDPSLAQAYVNCEERFAKNGGYEYKSRAKGILTSLGFAPETHGFKISTLSGGQKTRVALAALLLREPDILLLDEPTNHLDIDALAWLEDFLISYPKTVLCISHDRYFLDRITTHILDIENKQATLYQGNYTSFTEKKKKDREIQEKHYKNQQKEIKRIEEYIALQKRWNREKNIIAAESRQKQLDKMEKLDRPSGPLDTVRITFNKSSEGANEVLTLRGLSKAYGPKKLFEAVDLTVMRRDHAFITGPNGCGKSTLIKTIAKKLMPDSGNIYWGQNTVYAYYDQENQDLDESNTVIDELWNAYPDLTQTEVRNTLALFLFKGEDVIKPVSVLSGGEKARLTLAKLMLSKMNVLILDEPTNHLDISSREALENALLQFDGTIIAVSHDRYFIKKLATRMLCFNLENEHALYDFKGNYTEFESFRKRYEKGEITEKTPDAPTAAKTDYLNQKKQQSELRRLKKQYEKALSDSERIEKEIETTEIEIESCSTDHVKLSELYTKKEQLEEKLLEAYEIIENYTEE
ncbi:MAG: ABC-F family ATP-binding cassette domain-containing protein [Ruminococcaceae bacterium]|nr:ABC-F family ATP-binding cassette domain-containing protein [Oscillospiraceae bacterium]